MTEPAPRFDIALPVELTEGREEARFQGVSVNISESGMLVRAEQERPRGTTLSFSFAPFGGTAQVIWIRQLVEEQEEGAAGTLLGMKFVSMKRHDRKTLVRMLNAPPSLSTA
jgi:c-di-GMP-binding flagellar brake protein YcgR